MKKYNIAIIGATGAVGREMLSLIKERKFPYNEVYALASRDSIGKEVSFGEDDILRIEAVENFDFKNIDLALFAAGSERSREFALKAAGAGAIVIDNSSFFRMDEEVPLIVPEINGNQIENYKKNIIANPNCVVIQVVMALGALHEEIGIKRIVLSTYQSVSGAGTKAMDELFSQTKAKFVYQTPEKDIFPREIAFNVIPQIGEFEESGYTEEEIKIVQEIKKILGSDIAISATCVRVPVFVGHSVSLNVEFESDISPKEAEKIIQATKGVEILGHGKYQTPVDVSFDMNVHISRIRKDNSRENTLNMWVVADNLRKGAALNAVQIAEDLVRLNKI